MPLLPPEIYVPAFAFLVGWLALFGAAIKVLFARNTQLADRIHTFETSTSQEVTRALLRSAEGLRDQNELNRRFLDYGLTTVARRVASRRRTSESEGGGGEAAT